MRPHTSRITLEHRRDGIVDLRFEGVVRLYFPAATTQLWAWARAEFDGDVYFGLYRLAIDQGLVKLPFPHVVHHSRHQRGTAADGFQIFYASISVNESTHGHRVSRAGIACHFHLVPRDLREQFADCQFCDRPVMMPATFSRHHDKSLHFDGNGASTRYRLYRQSEQK